VTYKLTIDQKPAYLHVAVTGRNSGENVVRYTEEVIRECTPGAASGCFQTVAAAEEWLLSIPDAGTQNPHR